MSCREVRTQEEFDSALAEGACIHIVEGEITVSSSGSATVRAYGSATVEAYGSATVEAYGSATVRAYGAVHISAYSLAQITAGRFVTIHRHARTATVTGGNVIEVPNLTGTDPRTWCDYYGLPIDDNGQVILFKAVDEDLRSGWDMHYPIGQTVTAPDWDPKAQCGGGLHLGPTPRHAAAYTGGDSARYLACRVEVDTMVTLGDKVKARSVEVLQEVDRDGWALTAAAPVATGGGE